MTDFSCSLLKHKTKQSDNRKRFQSQLKNAQDSPSFEETKNKRKRPNDVYVQVSKSPSPVKSLTLSTKDVQSFNEGKLDYNISLKKTVDSSVKLFKTFSEKLSDLRSKKETNGNIIGIQKRELSKGFVTLNEKNKLIDPEIFSDSQSKENAQLFSSEDPYDPYSMLYLSKRNISYDELRLYFKGKKIFLLPELLKTVTAPTYEFPDHDNDYIVIGIIAYKSIPKYIQNGKKNTNIKSRYCVLTLTNLKWEINLFLFDGAFERYWKIQVGYIIAILNPGIMKPKKIDSGDFSLVLSHEYDSLLELGLSRDLGFCNALRRDGKQCTSWIDRRHSEVCGFHVDQGMHKIRNARMEVATGTRLYSPKKNKYISSKVGYSKGPKSAEGLLAEHTGWVHDPWNGNVFMISNFLYGYKRDALDAKMAERMRSQRQKQMRESNMVSRLLAYEQVSRNVASDSLKIHTKLAYPISSVSLENSSKLYPEPFSTQSVKRIGFNPYRHLASMSNSSISPITCSLLSDICCNSDSDLEII
ncbi:hypothetical protein T552_03317 [Pneumocystis carinii B80]|uniref:Uncharacterized protein n=1 Tax=Pneumocystis carinii (strain B80) TaxID=1408658 RepID=A0A0W4ZBD4_PNEC8|nr:hypothetical protein T552_03317 [Pneumocystis carinii B80]KTW25705.1 hypothetical protein T552_03317 [Pneumocystis carinii B80]